MHINKYGSLSRVKQFHLKHFQLFLHEMCFFFLLKILTFFDMLFIHQITMSKGVIFQIGFYTFCGYN